MPLYYCCSSQSIDRITWLTSSTAKESKVSTIPKGWAESTTRFLDHSNLIKWNKGISCDFLVTSLLIPQIQHVLVSLDDAPSLSFNFTFQNCLEFPGGDSKIIEKQVTKSVLCLELSRQQLYLRSVSGVPDKECKMPPTCSATTTFYHLCQGWKLGTNYKVFSGIS